MGKVIKTTFEDEQRAKDEAFLKLTPLQRLEWAFNIKKRMRLPGVDYSYAGKKVTVKKIL
jgi:hypothetical protein